MFSQCKSSDLFEKHQKNLCLFSGVSSGMFVITQSPDVSVVEGQTVNISCCWTGEPATMTVSWLKNQTTIKSTKFLNNHSDKSLRNETSDCSVLTFMTIKRDDAGTYTCKMAVEIPVLTVFEGHSTVITVTAPENTMDNTTGGR